MTYTVRFRDRRKRLVSLSTEEGLPQDLRSVIAHAEIYCKNYETEVAVLMHGSLVCVVKPD